MITTKKNQVISDLALILESVVRVARFIENTEARMVYLITVASRSHVWQAMYDQDVCFHSPSLHYCLQKCETSDCFASFGGTVLSS